MSIAKVNEAQEFCNAFNYGYERKHYEFEKQFWGTKMALKGDGDEYSTELLSKTQGALDDYLSNPETLQKALTFLSQINTGAEDDSPNSKDLIKTLEIIIRTCKCNDKSSSPESKQIRDEATKKENELTGKRNKLSLGYVNPEDGTLKEMSSVGLRNLMRVSKDESLRKAAYEGLRSIGPFVTTNGFPEIVKLRNQFAKSLGYADFYDYKVTNAEGFGKTKLFEILDGLEEATRPLMEEARKELERKLGSKALDPWNMSYMMAGDVITKMDPYFPFSKAVERYLQTYAALNISYKGSVLNLDLLDRKNKYSNGFCHWPKVAWVKPDGTWQPAEANFTSLADPKAVGSGLTALQTLMHEGGHAAHFANIEQPSPLFSQERAPTSVAYAENQSMFLDSLVGDSAWRAKYALCDKNETVIPFDVIEEEIKSTHPFAVFQLRAMLVVSYFEKALYELSPEEVTSDKIQSLANEMETKIQGGPSPRPLLSVPHIISDEASCYYHGYTLAEMSVHQTREYFLKTDGYIVDNPRVGPALTESYWKCGNSRPFLDLVKDLTGKPLTGDAWVSDLQESVDDRIERERKEYDAMRSKLASGSTSQEEEKNNEQDLNRVSKVENLNMTVRFVDGDTLISNSSTATGGLMGACKEFEAFVNDRIQQAASSS